jgi:hypothetical protein
MTTKYALSSSVLFLLALNAACDRAGLRGLSRPDSAAHGQDGSPTVEVPPVSQPPIGGQCPDGQSPCGKGDGLRCIDLSRSKDHCGACGQACAAGIVCQAGACQPYRCKGALSFKSLADTTGDARTLGDFDGDGILDLVVGTPESSGPLTLMYGAGDGTFPISQVIESNSSNAAGGWRAAWQARAGDLDGDGLLDLTSIRAGDRAVTVRLGSGARNGPFGDPTVYPTSSDTLSGLLLADLDGDGRLDLVSGATQGLEYWRGTNGGRFEHQATLDSPAFIDEPGVPTATDWNGDGIVDLVYSDFGFGGLGFPAIGGGGNLLFRLGRGDGSFDSEVACALLTGVVGDLDHDHRPDLINSGSGLQGTSLLLGIEGCHASKLVPLSDWPKQAGIALADFNGDDNLDVVADNDKNVIVRVGDGQGGFAQSLSMSAYQAGQWPIGVFLTGDLNRDGKLDLIFSRDGKWGVFLNTCQ